MNVSDNAPSTEVAQATEAEQVELASIVGSPGAIARLPGIVPYHVGRAGSDRWHLIGATSPLALNRAVEAGCEVARLDCDLRNELPLLAPARTPLPAGHRLLVATKRFRVFAVPRNTILAKSVQGTKRLRPGKYPLTQTDLLPETPMHRVQDLELCFRVSLNEEHIEVTARSGGACHTLRARFHNFLLLTLARQRLADQMDGAPEEGWLLRDQLCGMLNCDYVSLNVDVFRIRRQFEKLDLINPHDIIERRPDTTEVRLGVRNLRIEGAETRVVA